MHGLAAKRTDEQAREYEAEMKYDFPSPSPSGEALRKHTLSSPYGIPKRSAAMAALKGRRRQYFRSGATHM